MHEITNTGANGAAPPMPRLGIIGGGQLAKMTAAAAAQLGCEVVIFERSQEFPAHSVDTQSIIGDWNDPAQLMRFAGLAQAVSLENEFVDVRALRALESAGIAVVPSADSLALVQDKLEQKHTFQKAGLPVVEFADAPDPASVSKFGFPCVLKQRRNAYDGKGNAWVDSSQMLDEAWASLGGDKSPLYVERRFSFARELAVIVTRARDGHTVSYPVVETVNRHHICNQVIYPAPISDKTAALTRAYAIRAVEAVDGIGSFGVEFFLGDDDAPVINEIAPRVHNTGHYTIEACACSQFENHVRAVFGLPLGSTEPRAPAAAMVNLLGSGHGSGEPRGLAAALAVPGAHVHIYGKLRSTPGRKMGHVTALGADANDALSRAQRAADLIRFGD